MASASSLTVLSAPIVPMDLSVLPLSQSSQ